MARERGRPVDRLKVGLEESLAHVRGEAPLKKTVRRRQPKPEQLQLPPPLPYLAVSLHDSQYDMPRDAGLLLIEMDPVNYAALADFGDAFRLLQRLFPTPASLPGVLHGVTFSVTVIRVFAHEIYADGELEYEHLLDGYEVWHGPTRITHYNALSVLEDAEGPNGFRLDIRPKPGVLPLAKNTDALDNAMLRVGPTEHYPAPGAEPVPSLIYEWMIWVSDESDAPRFSASAHPERMVALFGVPPDSHRQLQRR